MSNLARTIALLLIAAVFWFLQVYGTARPQVVPASAPQGTFSAVRAETVLARILGPERPHPVSSDENARVRGRIIGELAALGLQPFVHRGFACHSPRDPSVLICASVSDVIAQVIPGEGRAILLLAHYDSVPAGPGASDDESGVATVIETSRALLARGARERHPVLAVLSDGEEADLLGAALFLRDPTLKARVGAVINVEARGNRGPSLLFQTSPGDAPLVDLYAKNTTDYATSSLYHEIYRLLPNDTDLTLFLAAGFPSFNFAYVGGVEDYHTANDTRANLDRVSLQEQGDNMLGVANGLEHTDFARLRGSDAIYLDVLGRWLPRAPVSWALPLAVLALMLLLSATVWRTPGLTRQWLGAIAATPALVILAGGSGFLLHEIAAAVSGTPDPAYAYPAALRIALALALGAAALLASRLATELPAIVAWSWLSLFGVVAAILAPGLSPYFIFPALVAGVLLFLARLAPGAVRQNSRTVALVVSAQVALLVWSEIGTSGESISGLKLHVMFTVPFAIGLSALIPLLAQYTLPHRIWAGTTACLFIAALIAAVVQGLMPSYSAAAAQRLNVTYVQNGRRAVWAVNAVAPLPATMRRAAAFSVEPEELSPWLPLSYVAPAGAPRFALPVAKVVSDRNEGATRVVTLALQGSPSASQMFVEIPAAAKLKAVDIEEWHHDAPSGSFTLACVSRDCANAQVTLSLATGGRVRLAVHEHRFGLPPFARTIAAARPEWAVQSQNGDGVTLINTLNIPAAK